MLPFITLSPSYFPLTDSVLYSLICLHAALSLKENSTGGNSLPSTPSGEEPSVCTTEGMLVSSIRVAFNHW